MASFLSSAFIIGLVGERVNGETGDGRRRTGDDGRWTMDGERETMDGGPWTMDGGRWKVVDGEQEAGIPLRG
ncbi:MAG: hypothetical protein WC832_02465 [Anaerolineales bacterium]